MKMAATSLVILTVVAFMAGILIVDYAVDRYKQWRKRKDAFIPDYTVGAFRGVDTDKKW